MSTTSPTRPLIGVTTYYLTPAELARQPGPRATRDQPAQFALLTYTRAVWRAGGLPWLLPALADPELAPAVAGRLDGLLLTGGEDVTPGFRAAPVPPAEERTVIERDRCELALWEAVRAAGKPVLGICRGLQAANLFAGGTLIADIPAWAPDSPIAHRQAGRPADRPVHPIAIEPGGLTAELFGPDPLEVNSSHHQAVERPAPGFRVAARAPDGVVEAIEPVPGSGGGAFLGIQWHPEMLQDGPLEHWRVPFAWLVQAAARAGAISD